MNCHIKEKNMICWSSLKTAYLFNQIRPNSRLCVHELGPAESCVSGIGMTGHGLTCVCADVCQPPQLCWLCFLFLGPSPMELASLGNGGAFLTAPRRMDFFLSDAVYVNCKHVFCVTNARGVLTCWVAGRLGLEEAYGREMEGVLSELTCSKSRPYATELLFPKW